MPQMAFDFSLAAIIALRRVRIILKLAGQKWFPPPGADQ
jgi:hypothetical protein